MLLTPKHRGFVLITALTLSQVSSAYLCPFLGVSLNPSPNPSCDPVIQSIAANLTSILEQNAIANWSYSIRMESIHEDTPGAPIFDYHHTAAAEFISPDGVQEVNASTIYRIGSVSKIMPVYALQLYIARHTIGSISWDDPITKYIPELRAIAQKQKENGFDPVSEVQWESITLRALASQLGGLSRDFTLADLSLPSIFPDPNQILPALPASDIPVCGGNSTEPACTRQQLFAGFPARSPTFAPFVTPAYANPAFRLLGYVLENLTGIPYNEYVVENIMQPLNLSSTDLTANKPAESLGALVTGDTWWETDLGDDIAEGGLYSSSTGILSLARSILNSTLIPSAVTRSWLKPAAHTSSLEVSIGLPWEIVRTEIDTRVVDFYTKSGAIGLYAAFLVMVPDHGVVFSVLGVGADISDSALYVLAEPVAEAFLPALEALAKQEAAVKYGGTYVSAQGATNISMTLGVNTTDGAGSGLIIERFLVNGTNGLDIIAEVYGYDTAEGRLYESGLQSPGAGGNTIVNFRATFLPVEVPTSALSTSKGWFNLDCVTWSSADGEKYGGIGLDDFDIQVNASGVATGLNLKAWRTPLCKVGTEGCN